MQITLTGVRCSPDIVHCLPGCNRGMSTKHHTFCTLLYDLDEVRHFVDYRTTLLSVTSRFTVDLGVRELLD